MWNGLDLILSSHLCLVKERQAMTNGSYIMIWRDKHLNMQMGIFTKAGPLCRKTIRVLKIKCIFNLISSGNLQYKAQAFHHKLLWHMIRRYLIYFLSHQQFRLNKYYVIVQLLMLLCSELAAEQVLAGSTFIFKMGFFFSEVANQTRSATICTI